MIYVMYKFSLLYHILINGEFMMYKFSRYKRAAIFMAMSFFLACSYTLCLDIHRKRTDN